MLAPRGAAKSTYVSFAYPLREALEKREPFTVIISDTADQAKDFLRQIKAQLEDNELLKADYPNDADKGPIWRDSRIQLRNGCEILAIGTGGKLRGRKSAANRRPTLVVGDDLQNKDHIVSSLRRERSWEWFTKDVMAVGEPDTNFFVVGTAIHREAVVCRLETTPGWRSRKWKSLVEWPERLDLWTDWESRLHDYSKGETEAESNAAAFYKANESAMLASSRALWPERYTVLDLMRRRASDGHAAFESEYQNNPVNPATCEWSEEYFTHGAFWFDEWPEDLQVRTIALDPSKGKSDRQGDYSAIVKYGRDRRGYEYVEADLRRRPVDVMCHDLVATIKDFNPDAVAIETNAFQELLVVPVRQACQAHHLDSFPLRELDNTVPKPVRIRRLTQPLAQRRLRFKTRSPGTVMLVNQLKDWPAVDHQDGPDCLEMCRRVAIEVSNKRAIGKSR